MPQTMRSRRVVTNYLHEEHSTWTHLMFWRFLFPDQRVTALPLPFLFLKLCAVKFMTARLFVLVCANWRCIVVVQASWVFVDVLLARQYDATLLVVYGCIWPNVIPLFLPFTLFFFVSNLQSWKPRLFPHKQIYSNIIDWKLIFCNTYYFQT